MATTNVSIDIGDVNNFRQATAALYQDALRAAGVSGRDLALLSKHATLHGRYLNMAELAIAGAGGNQAELAKAAAGIAIGTLATVAAGAGLAAIGVTVGAGTLAVAAGILAADYFDGNWDKVKDFLGGDHASPPGSPNGGNTGGPFTDPNPWSDGSPVPGDANGNGIPDILESARDKFGAGKRQASPIILDLDGDGVETTKVNTGTYFDHDGNGLAESTGWVAADDGLLVRDVDGSGWIDSGAELFGNHTRLANGQMAANGFEALRDLDSIANGGNADGKLDASDAAFASLKVWEDADGDGYHSAGEVISLEDAGVQSINVSYTTSTQVDANGNAHSQIGSYTTTNGATRTATDVWFQTDKMNTLADDWLEVPDDIAAMPDIRGFGNVHSLQQAMVRDGSGKDPGRKAANGREWRAAA